MALMLGVSIVTSEPDSIVRDLNGVVLSHLRLAPLEIEDIVCDVVPLFACVFCVVKLFENPAGFILKLSTGGPGSSKGPVALSWMEEELLDTFARVESREVSSAVFGDPIDTVCS